MSRSTLLLIGATLALSWQSFSGQSVSSWDYQDYVLPEKRALLHDWTELFSPPLWNPHVQAGAPYFGHFSTGGPYPLQAVLLGLPDALGVNLWSLLHVLIGAFAMRFWARTTDLAEEAATVAALVFIAGSAWPAKIHTGHTTALVVLAWAPAVMGWLERLVQAPGPRPALWLAACMSMMLLGGHTQFIYIFGLMGLAWFVVALGGGPASLTIRRVGWAVAAAAGALALSAVHLLAAVEVMPAMARFGLKAVWAIHGIWIRPSDLPHLLLGLPWDATDYPWERAWSLGIAGTTLFAVGAWVGRRTARTRTLLACMAMALLMSLGPVSPAHWLASWGLPLYGTMSVIPRFLLVFVLGGPLLAGIGAAALRRGPARFLAGLALLEGLVVSTAWIRPEPPRGEYDIAPLPEGRIYDNRKHLSNAPVLSGGESIVGLDSLMLSRYLRAYHLIWSDGDPPSAVSAYPVNGIRRRPLFDLLSIRSVVTREEVKLPGFVRERSVGDAHVYRNTQAFPRAFTVAGARAGPPGTDLDPRRFVLLEPGSPEGDNPGAYAEAEILRRGPGWIDVRSEGEHPRYLVVSEILCPGWKAWVDGTPAAVRPAWHTLLCVELPAGPHEVSVRFEPTGLKVGAWVSLLAWVGWGLALWRGTNFRSIAKQS